MGWLQHNFKKSGLFCTVLHFRRVFGDREVYTWQGFGYRRSVLLKVWGIDWLRRNYIHNILCFCRRYPLYMVDPPASSPAFPTNPHSHTLIFCNFLPSIPTPQAREIRRAFPILLGLPNPNWAHQKTFITLYFPVERAKDDLWPYS